MALVDVGQPCGDAGEVALAESAAEVFEQPRGRGVAGAELGERVALQPGDRAGDEEGQPHRGAGHLPGRAEQREDAGADHGADADECGLPHRQVLVSRSCVGHVNHLPDRRLAEVTQSVAIACGDNDCASGTGVGARRRSATGYPGRGFGRPMPHHDHHGFTASSGRPRGSAGRRSCLRCPRRFRGCRRGRRWPPAGRSSSTKRTAASTFGPMDPAANSHAGQVLGGHLAQPPLRRVCPSRGRRRPRRWP